MYYCPNPNCPPIAYPESRTYCQRCNTNLLWRDRYHLLSLLGQSRQGRTWLAQDHQSCPEPQRVIKQLWGNPPDGRVAKDWFSAWVVALATLGEANLGPLLMDSWWLHQDQSYQWSFVHAYLPGPTLALGLQQGRLLDEAAIWTLLQTTLPILQWSHDRQIWHLDLKPANFISTPSYPGAIVLVGFGAALLQASQGERGGDPEYAAPEQLSGQAEAASDLYSLGLTCLSLLTGVSPFQLWDASQNDWIWQDYLATPISQDLAKILHSLTIRDPKQRCSAATAALEQWAQGRQRPVALQLPLSVWRYQTTLTGHQGLFAGVTAIAFQPNQPMLASASEDQTIRLWHIGTGQCLHVLRGHCDRVEALAFDRQGQWLASAGADCTLRLWAMPRGDHLATLSGHRAAIKTLALHPNGEILASGSADKTFCLWHLPSLTLSATLTGHHLAIQALAFSADGQWLASAGADRIIQIWPLQAGLPIAEVPALTLRAHTWGVTALAFSPVESLLASGSTDNTIRLWHLPTGRLCQTIPGHSWAVSGLVFLADGQTLVSSSWDKTLKFWDVATGSLQDVLQHHGDSITGVAISADGCHLASGSRDRTIAIWRNRLGTIVRNTHPETYPAQGA